MGMTKQELIEMVRRNLGYPLIKVELEPEHYDDAIKYARLKYIKWAVGNATEEVWFTMLLRSGEMTYEMPAATVDVIGYTDGVSMSEAGGINTLFTIDNYLYSQGMYDPLLKSNFGLVSYHIARDFLESIQRYQVSKYTYRYNKSRNILEVNPLPDCDFMSYTPPLTSCSDVPTTETINSPGFVLIRANMIEGGLLPTYAVTPETSGSRYRLDNVMSEYIYENDWFIDYVTALCKVTLGRTYRKFSQFTSLGNVGISLDGSELIQEGTEEKRELEEKLKEEECYYGYGIEIG